MKTTKAKAVAPQVPLKARVHDEGRMRVWCTNWTGDQFEVLTNAEFAALEASLTRFAIYIPVLDFDED